jgi:hypothetical protein
VKGQSQTFSSEKEWNDRSLIINSKKLKESEIPDRRNIHESVYLSLLFSKVSAKQCTNNANLTSMPVTNAQKTAAEQVIEAIKGVTSPRKKRVLAELFLELVDKDTWANYYEVSFQILIPALLHSFSERVP